MVCRNCQNMFGWLCSTGDTDVILSICEAAVVNRNPIVWYDKVKVSLSKYVNQKDKFYNVFCITMTNNVEERFQIQCMHSQIIDSIWEIIQNSDGAKIVVREIKEEHFEIVKLKGEINEQFFASSMSTKFLFIKS